METLIVAHRGESFDAPENTMAAINLAWERGVEAVEIDVQLSKDNKVVVIHDFNTKRLAGVNKKVKDQTFDELRKLDVGLWKNEKWKGEKIPDLLEVLESVPDGKKLIIEIKSESRIIAYLKTIIENSKLKTSQIEFIGFDLKTMALTKKATPNHNVLWLLDLDYYWINKILKPSIKKAISNAKKYHIDGLNVWAGKMLNRDLVNKVRSSGLLLYTWTVNDVQKAKDLIDYGVDAITTDGVHWLNSHLNMVTKP